LVIAALLVPVYQSASVSSSGAVTDGSATLVGVNGWGALLAAAAPLAAAAVTGYALWRRTGRQGAGVLAWTVTGLLACFNFLAMLSIGVFVIPVTLALAIACGTHGPKPRGVVTRSSVAS
jgi:4-amino-4-deoxy-L-arabinose transferase-like glycosyltransferase